MPDSNPPHLEAGGNQGPAAPRDWRTMHLWQIQPVRDLLILATVFGILYLGWLLSLVTVPLLLAIALAYLFEPLVSRVTRRAAVSRPGAALGIILFAFVMVIAPVTIGVAVGVLQGTTYAQRVGTNVQNLVDVVKAPDNAQARAALPKAWERLATRLIDLRAEAERARARGGRPVAAAQTAVPHTPDVQDPALHGPVPPETDHSPAYEQERDNTSLQLYRFFETATTFIRDNAQAIGQRAIATGADALQAVLRWMLSLGMLVFSGFLTAFFFFFICTGWGRVLAFWESMIPERRRGLVIDLLHKMDKVISGFIRGRLIICSILILYYTAAYWLIGAPVPLLLGPVIGALTLVPYAASVGIPVVILAMFLEPSDVSWQAQWWWIVLAPIAVNMGQQGLDDYLLTPRIQGEATGMDTPTILFASLAGGVLAGVYGLLIAIPAAACIKILLREILWPRFKAWAEGRERDPLPISRN